MRAAAAIRGLVTFILFSLNLVFWGTPFLFLGVFKLLIAWWPAGRLGIVLLLANLAEHWVGTNNLIVRSMIETKFEVRDDLTFSRDRRYLIFANHQTWVDIVVIVRQFYRRMPFIRFFMKQELIWVPIAGQACWALEFPFMKRYSAEYLEKHPEARGRDLETTRIACERFRLLPVAILNFLEGTRFSREKREDQQSPYRNLLRPRIGGAGHVLATMGSQLDAVVDVTIVYSIDNPTVFDFLGSRIDTIFVDVRRLDVPAEFTTDAVTEDGEVRERFKAWVAEIWRRKDAVIAEAKERMARESTTLPS